MGRPGVLLVTSFYRRCSAKSSRLPEKTWGYPIGRAFGGEKNDCPRKLVGDLVWNASCILGKARGSQPLTIKVGLVFLADGTCPDKGEGMPCVQ